MTSAIFDQKMFRPASDMYYFQLVPTLLTVRNPSFVKGFKTSSTQFRLKIVKGVQLCDEMKKSIAVKAVNGVAAFEKVGLIFNLPSFNPNRNIQFAVVLYKSEEGKEEEEVGRHSIMSSAYVVQFKDSKTRFYQDDVNLSDNYSLKFDLYIDHSRFGLEKLIKEANEEKKEQKRQNLTTNTKREMPQNPTVNQAKSQIHSDSQKVQIITAQGRFMSPTRKIVRKQSDGRKVLRKQSSPTRSQDQTSSKKAVKFLSRNSQREESTMEKTQSLAEQQAKKLSQKIRQQEEKREKLVREKEMADSQKKSLEQKRKRQEESAKKSEQNRRVQAQRKRDQEEEARKNAVEQRKKQVQRRKEEQEAARKAEQNRKAAQQKRLQAQRKREQDEEVRRTAAQQKKREAQKKRQEQENLRKAEEAKRVAEQKRIEAQKKRQADRIKRLESQKQEKARRQAQIQQENTRVQEERQKQQEKKRLVQTEETKRKKQALRMDLGKNTSKAAAGELTANKKQEKITKAEETRKTVRKKHEPIEVRVKTQSANQVTKYVFETSSVSDSSWSKPVKIKPTGSHTFDKDGNLISSSTHKDLKNPNEMNLKTKLIIAGFVILAIIFIFMAMRPSARGRRRH